MFFVSEGVIHLGLQPPWITPPSICLILHILLSNCLIYYILIISLNVKLVNFS